jgi:hypothetical protein
MTRGDFNAKAIYMDGLFCYLFKARFYKSTHTQDRELHAAGAPTEALTQTRGCAGSAALSERRAGGAAARAR